MDDDYESHRTFNFKIFKRLFIPSSSPELEIKFNFFFQNKQSQWVRNQDSTETLWDGSIIEDYVLITRRQFLCNEETCEEIGKELMNMPLSDDEREQLIEFVWNEALESIWSKQCTSGYTLVDLDFWLVVENRQVFGSSHGMVDSSLKKYDNDSGNTDICCSICLEDMSDEDGEATWRRRRRRLPCSHVFHGDCIEKWLRTTNNCPLCRFKMPTPTS